MLVTPELTGLANAIIALCYLVIGGLISAGLVRERRAGINPLGLATALIFFSCAGGHAVHAEHYLLRPDVYALDDDLWHQLLVDGLTLIPAVAYLAQRHRYGLVIRGAHALLDFERRLDVSEALRNIGEDIAAQTELDELLRRIGQHARTLLDADYAAVVAVDSSSQLHCQAAGMANGWNEDAWRTAVFLGKTGATASFWHSRQPVVVSNLRELPESTREQYAVHAAEGARRILGVPIVRGADVIGSIVVGYRSRGVVTKEDLSRAAALASQAAIAIENARLIEDLRQADRLKDEFLSAAAHELKTPITVVKGYTQLLLRSPEETCPRQRAMLNGVGRGVERIELLTRDLLAVARLRSDYPAVRPERFELSSLVREVVQRVGRPTEPERFSVRAPDVLPVEADATLIGEVLGRLVENAIRYSPAQAPVEVEVRRSGEEAVVSVRDHGVGIPVDRRPHVFEPFYEPVPPGEQGYVGLVSLGLFVSKRIIDAHGGRIWFASEPGQGSVFSFGLPLASSEVGIPYG